MCRRCANHHEQCIYDAAKGETVSGSLKRRVNTLQHENTQLRDLLRAVHDRPQMEAQEIYRRLRTSSDPLAVLESVKHADLLLSNQQQTALFEESLQPRLRQLNQTSLEASAIKVSARPWTVVAGDGIVSELITDFFTWDNAYLFPSIDLVTFLQDMRQEADQAKWCSSVLVNAICAQRCVRPRRHSLLLFQRMILSLTRPSFSWNEPSTTES